MIFNRDVTEKSQLASKKEQESNSGKLETRSLFNRKPIKIPKLEEKSNNFSTNEGKNSTEIIPVQSSAKLDIPKKDIKKENATNKLKVAIKDDFLHWNYIMWENNANLCWLDASMALLVHNQTLRHESNLDKTSQIMKIIKIYDEAISVLNEPSNEKNCDRVQLAKDKLKSVQESSLSYLQPIMKYTEGEPDSAFHSLYNLITQDKQIKCFFEVDFAWHRKCEKCMVHRILELKKPIITLSKVKEFHPEVPVSLCQCPACKEPGLEMTLSYKNLPKCLIFHFENGAGNGKLQCLDFTVSSRKYEITGVIILEKGRDLDVNHFVTWIREPNTNNWLECNDLDDGISNFTSVPPSIKLEEVYIIAFESFDYLGTIVNNSDVTSETKSVLERHLPSSEADIPFIDISEETDDLKTASCTSNDKKHTVKESCTEKPDSDLSLKSGIEKTTDSNLFNVNRKLRCRKVSDSENLILPSHMKEKENLKASSDQGDSLKTAIHASLKKIEDGKSGISDRNETSQNKCFKMENKVLPGLFNSLGFGYSISANKQISISIKDSACNKIKDEHVNKKSDERKTISLEARETDVERKSFSNKCSKGAEIKGIEIRSDSNFISPNSKRVVDCDDSDSESLKSILTKKSKTVSFQSQSTNFKFQQMEGKLPSHIVKNSLKKMSVIKGTNRTLDEQSFLRKIRDKHFKQHTDLRKQEPVVNSSNAVKTDNFISNNVRKMVIEDRPKQLKSFFKEVKGDQKSMDTASSSTSSKVENPGYAKLSSYRNRNQIASAINNVKCGKKSCSCREPVTREEIDSTVEKVFVNICDFLEF